MEGSLGWANCGVPKCVSLRLDRVEDFPWRGFAGGFVRRGFPGGCPCSVSPRRWLQVGVSWAYSAVLSAGVGPITGDHWRGHPRVRSESPEWSPVQGFPWRGPLVGVSWRGSVLECPWRGTLGFSRAVPKRGIT
jgi:hypothetical protein